MERRNFLKTAGGIGGAALVGGAGLTAFTGGAAATAEQDLGTATVTSDDGTVDYVAIFGDSVIHWKGFDTPAQYFDIDIELEVVQKWDNQSRVRQQIHSTDLVDLDNEDWGNHDEELSGSGTRGTIESGIGLAENGDHDASIDWHVVHDPDIEREYGLPEDPVDASRLTVHEDGRSRTFTLVLRSTYTWYDADKNGIFAETFTSTLDVTVENIESQASAEDGDEQDGAVAQPSQ